MDRKPFFTIILCTYNRAALLRKAFESIRNIDYPSDEFELLVTDNNSTDDTKKGVEEFSASAPFSVRYILEKKRGLSAARNTAIKNARGEYIFLTDDDQLVDANVLKEHKKIIDKYGARVIQGNIDVTFPEGRPAWLGDDLARWLGKIPYDKEGPSSIELQGGNLVFKKDIFDTFGGFREDLGKGVIGYSEDTDFSRKLSAAGETIIFAPKALIYHIIPPEHATSRYLRKNVHQKGFSEGVIAKKSYPVWKAACDTFLKLISPMAKIVLYTLTFNKYKSLVAQTEVSYKLGFLSGYRRSFKRKNESESVKESARTER